ncbi:hypothetical protein ABW19_dt0201043 [Dactylella cylindrospora]|nr:hypothetical protein ABW19_dt0201043 [Dactylella cylindrospora]
MAAIATEESDFALRDGHKLYVKEWKTADAPAAAIVFLHGFSDHCNAYYDLFPDLAARGINVFSFDQRGWGRSSLDKKQWGMTGPSATVFGDLDEIITSRLSFCESQPTQPPLFLCGHSAGGCLTLTYAYSGSLRSKLAGYVAFSPFVRLAPAEQPNSAVLFVGKLAAKLLPNFQMLNQLDPGSVSRDPAVIKAFADDKLCHDTGTLIGISEMLERGTKLLQKETVKKFDKKKPILILHGSGDKITDFNGSKEFFGMLELDDQEFKEFDGWYHKLHADLPENRPIFSGYIADWILKRVDTAKKAEVPTPNL